MCAVRIRFSLIAALTAGAATGQSPDDFELHIYPIGTSDVPHVTIVGVWSVDGVQGWSLGVCHDPREVSIGDCIGGQDPACEACPNILFPDDFQGPGPTGQYPDFHSLNVYENGFTQGVVLSFWQAWDLDATEHFAILQVEYTYLDGAFSTQLEFCDTVGAPPVENVIVVGGKSYVPAIQIGAYLGPSISSCSGPSALHLSPAEDGALQVLLATQMGHLVSGFQFGLAHDSPGVEVAGVFQGEDLVGIGGADFFGVNLINEQHLTVGCVVDLEPDGDRFRTFPECMDRQEITVVSYRCSRSRRTSE